MGKDQLSVKMRLSGDHGRLKVVAAISGFGSEVFEAEVIMNLRDSRLIALGLLAQTALDEPEVAQCTLGTLMTAAVRDYERHDGEQDDDGE